MTLQSREEAPRHLEFKQYSGDTLSVYSQILGLSERRFPTSKEFPEQLLLDHAYLGDFFPAIRSTIRDGLERSQSVSWNEKNHNFSATELVVGTSNNADSLKHKLRIYFGKKALFHYHTHPSDEEEYGDPTWHQDFSVIDIVAMKAFPRSAYISAVGSDLGAVFVFQTEKTAKLPFYSLTTYFWELLKIFVGMGVVERAKIIQEKGYQSEKEVTEEDVKILAHRVADQIRLTKGGNYLKDADYGCYIWTPGEYAHPDGIVLRRFDVPI